MVPTICCTNKTYNKLLYPTYVKDTNPDTYIRVFKKAIKTNGKIVNEDLINLLGFTFCDSIFEWGKKFYMIIPIIFL
jgi:hypothetical protein